MGDDRRPDVLVLETQFDRHQRLDLLQRIQEVMPPKPAAVVIVEGGASKAAQRSLMTGAAGFVVTTSPLKDLIEVVRRAGKG